MRGKGEKKGKGREEGRGRRIRRGKAAAARKFLDGQSDNIHHNFENTLRKVEKVACVLDDVCLCVSGKKEKERGSVGKCLGWKYRPCDHSIK